MDEDHQVNSLLLSRLLPQQGVFDRQIDVTNGPVAASLATRSINASSPMDSSSFAYLSGLPELRGRVRHHVHSVIQCMPLTETQAYLEAMDCAQDLVQTESDPIQFVRYCHYDLMEAAKRLCKYWTERKNVFGPDRAFLPLVASAQGGALNAEDMALIEAGFLSFLPDNHIGQKCIISDRSRRPPTASLETTIRSQFYFFKVLAEEPLSQTDGAICLLIATSPKNYNMDMGIVKRCAYLTRHIFPVKQHVHLLCIPQPGLFSPIAAQLAQGVLNILHYYFDQMGNVQIHIQHSGGAQDAVLSELLAQGIPRIAVPKDFGGDYTFEDVSFPLLQERIVWERQAYLPSNIPGHLNLKQSTTDSEPRGKGMEEKKSSWLYNNGPPPPSYAKSPTGSVANPSKSIAAGPATPKEPSDPSCTTEDEQRDLGAEEQPTMEQLRAERLERRRKADVIRSRRKRERQRVEIENMKHESERLAHENEMLKSEQRRLERLLRDVEEIVADFNNI